MPELNRNKFWVVPLECVICFRRRRELLLIVLSDRNLKVSNLKSHLQELIAQREKLVAQERVLRVKYDQVGN